MKRSSDKTVLLCGLIAMIVTIIFYLLTFGNIFSMPMRMLSLVFLLLIEAIGTVKGLKFNKSILGVSTLILAFIHLGVVLVISLIYVNLFPFMIMQYILVNFMIMAIVAVIDIILLNFEARAKESNQKYINSSSVIDECYMKAKELLMEATSSEYQRDLNNIKEMLEYANRSELCGNEVEILSELDKLQISMNSKNEIVTREHIKTVQNMLKLRSIQTKKSGKF